jgi:PqqD family protein of HPr-rel-A system
MTSPLYAADPPGARRTVPLDGLTLIYHIPSSTTHVVASPVPEMLDALGQGPAAAGDLLARLRGMFELGEAEQAEAAIVARLAELEAIGLVYRA